MSGVGDQPCPSDEVGLGTVLKEWGRIGCIGFGGPPVHIRLLRDLCVDRRQWMTAGEFEDAVAACNLLPGPASTQLAIFCAWRLRGRGGAVAGGLAFIIPGFIVIVALAAIFLSGSPSTWVLATGAGAGAAVAAIAVRAGSDLLPASWSRARGASPLAWLRWAAYVALGASAAASLGPLVVLVLLACGMAEMLVRAGWDMGRARSWEPFTVVLLGASGLAGTGLALAWTAVKVGALSYGGGFVIIPLMQADAVDRYQWMTQTQFVNAVALGQVTPGPVVLTVAVVGFAAAGLGGAVLAAVIAFCPSFLFILAGGRHFDRLRSNARVAAFLMGAGPAAIGAILGSAVPLARVLIQPWQWAVLAGAFVLLFMLRRSSVQTLLLAAAAGVVVALMGGTIPGATQ